MSGIKKTNPIKNVFDSLKKQPSNYDPLSSSKGTVNISGEEMASSTYQRMLTMQKSQQRFKSNNKS
jgi:hypothetical protein